MKDYYTILNVSPFDSQWEIDEKLSSSIMRARWVSDTDNELPYQDILEAYFIIGDPHRRLEYDRQRLKLGLGKTRLIDLHSSSTARSDQSLSLNDLRSMTLKILPSPFDWCEIPGVDDYELITRWDPEGYGCGYTSWNHGSFHIPSFIISKFPITVAQYRAFLYAADGAQNETWYEGFPRPNADNIRWFDPVYEEDTSPITNIHWYDASAMCQWLGNRLGLRIRLPSEWEWQWAGQGPDGRNYPWGNEHHHAFDEPRIIIPLYYQKRLIGAGYEKIYTFGPHFRNEGLSEEHLQEFYDIEWYWAYADYRDNMELVRIELELEMEMNSMILKMVENKEIEKIEEKLLEVQEEIKRRQIEL